MGRSPGTTVARPGGPNIAGGARVTGPGGASVDERDGLYLSGSVGGGAVFTADLRLGWVIGSTFGLFASLGKAVVLDDEGGVVSLTGVGLRLWHGGVFIEGGAVSASVPHECEFDEPCGDRTSTLARFGVGGEFLHTEHFGMEIRGEMLTDRRDAVYLLAIGMTAYF